MRAGSGMGRLQGRVWLWHEFRCWLGAGDGSGAGVGAVEELARGLGTHVSGCLTGECADSGE